MKKTMKVALLISIALLACMLLFTACNDDNNPEQPDSTPTSDDANTHNHSDLAAQMTNTNFETPYSELYSIYTTAINHKAEYGCDLNITTLLTNMLYGQWKDADDNYIDYTYIYKNYNNTVGETWYGTNLPTSKISGNTYYYYTKVENGNLVIGYEDTITEEKTDNFSITFNETGITVLNKINNNTYNLSLNSEYDKVQKGNAKLAYICIAKKIFEFKVPDSVKVTNCHVDYEDQTVYATIQATNGFGGTVNTDYKLYESAGKYYIVEYSHNYASNVDLVELNQKLQDYVSSN